MNFDAPGEVGKGSARSRVRLSRSSNGRSRQGADSQSVEAAAKTTTPSSFLRLACRADRHVRAGNGPLPDAAGSMHLIEPLMLRSCSLAGLHLRASTLESVLVTQCCTPLWRHL